MKNDQLTPHLTQSDLPLTAQVSILLQALDRIAAWDDGAFPDDRSAFVARRALESAGFRYLLGDQRPINGTSAPLGWSLDDTIPIPDTSAILNSI